MKRSLGVMAAAAATIVWALPAGAQTAATSRVTLGVVAGAAAVQEVGALVGGTLGVKWTDHVEFVGDGLWMSDAATRRRQELATGLASYLQAHQLSAASGTVKAPTLYAGGGVRLPFLGPRSWQPYVTVTAGMARIALEPTITLAGGDVTTKLSEFGVTLGSDLTGNLTKPAVSGGFGVRTYRGRCYFDVGLRYIYIHTDEQATNVIGAGGTFGFGL